MNLILAILMYLNILLPGGTYYQSFINNEITELETQIVLIENDPVQMETVDDVYLDQVPSITILTDGTW